MLFRNADIFSCYQFSCKLFPESLFLIAQHYIRGNWKRGRLSRHISSRRVSMGRYMHIFWLQKFVISQCVMPVSVSGVIVTLSWDTEPFCTWSLVQIRTGLAGIWWPKWIVPDGLGLSSQLVPLLTGRPKLNERRDSPWRRSEDLASFMPCVCIILIP